MQTEAVVAAAPSAPAASHLPSPPAQLTPFIGRERELAELMRTLASTRLVTLTGAGGSGKTRLAVELTARMAGSGPVAWIDLAPLEDPSLLARHVAVALDVREHTDESAQDSLIAQLCGRALLLVLDNCEHLVDAAAAFVRALLLGCPRVRVLATSREALGVGGETAWLVPRLEDDEACRLFIARAREVNATFALSDDNRDDVAAICRRLDGIPLAIELAAARTKLLAPAQIATRLDDVFRLLGSAGRTTLPRQRTLRETIDWSHDLLSEPERTLFRRLGVFVGGFTLEAAETVCAAPPIERDDVLDLLATLVDKSMVRPAPEEARFALLEPMRQYAQEKLREAGEEDATVRAHSAYFAAFVEQAEPHIRGGSRASDWMGRIARDHLNLLAARDRAAAHDATAEVALRIDTALLWFHFTVGLFKEPRRRLQELLAREPTCSPVVRGRALTALSTYAIWQGDYAAVAPPLIAAVDILKDAGDPESLAFALIGLGTAVGLAGDRNGADALLGQAQAAVGGRGGAVRSGYGHALLFALADYWRGVVAQSHGDAARARACFESAISVGRDFGNHPTIAHPLAALVRLLALQGELDAAEAALAESLPIHARNDDRWGLVQALDSAAYLASGRGDPARAARLLGAADAIRERVCAVLPPHERVDRECIAAKLAEQLGPHRFDEHLRAGHDTPLDRIVVEAIGAPVVASVASIAPGAAAPPLPDAGEAARLRIHALGPLRIMRDGVDVERDEFAPAKPRELLLFLLTHPDGATREQVGLALWPDQPAARVANSFHVTLHRLRRALGDTDAIELRDERYVVSASVSCWFDVLAFERAASTALAAVRAGRAEVEQLAAAATLCRGAFLDDEVVGDWHLDTRDRLQRLHVATLRALGAELMRKERWDEAADTYRHLLVVDDLDEDACRALMTCLARVGDRAGALRMYRQLVERLDTELEAEPAPETTELFERLQQAQRV